MQMHTRHFEGRPVVHEEDALHHTDGLRLTEVQQLLVLTAGRLGADGSSQTAPGSPAGN